MPLQVDVVSRSKRHHSIAERMCAKNTKGNIYHWFRLLKATQLIWHVMKLFWRFVFQDQLRRDFV